MELLELMPTVIGPLKQVYPGLDPATRSLRVWLYAAPVAFPQTGPTSGMPGGEVPLAQAHYLVVEGWTGNNGNGTNNLPRQVIDSGSQTLQQEYPQAQSLEDAIAVVFPPPGPD